MATETLTGSSAEALLRKPQAGDASVEAGSPRPAVVMLRRRQEESIDVYDVPADNPISLPEVLLDVDQFQVAADFASVFDDEVFVPANCPQDSQMHHQLVEALTEDGAHQQDIKGSITDKDQPNSPNLGQDAAFSEEAAEAATGAPPQLNSPKAGGHLSYQQLLERALGHKQLSPAVASILGIGPASSGRTSTAAAAGPPRMGSSWGGGTLQQAKQSLLLLEEEWERELQEHRLQQQKRREQQKQQQERQQEQHLQRTSRIFKAPSWEAPRVRRLKVRASAMPRESAAVQRHIKRHGAYGLGPASLYATGPLPQQLKTAHPDTFPPAGDTRATSTAPAAPRQEASLPASSGGGQEPAYERLFKLGMMRAVARSSPGSPPWLQEKQSRARRLSEDEWNRISARLYEEARHRAERMTVRREQQALAMSPDSGALSDGGGRRASPKPVRRRRRSEGGCNVPPRSWAQISFLDRQDAYRQWRLEKLQRQQQEKMEAEEKEIEENCTFSPAINEASRYIERNVELLHAWDARRQIQTVMAAAEKEEKQAFQGTTFAPEINARSRSIALRSWAAKPDPRRPWTASPAVTTAPEIKQYSPPDWHEGKSPTSRAADRAREILSSSGAAPFPRSPSPPRSGGGPLNTGETWSPLDLQLGPWGAGSALRAPSPPIFGGWAAQGGAGAAAGAVRAAQAVVPVAPGDGVAFVQISMPPGLGRQQYRPVRASVAGAAPSAHGAFPAHGGCASPSVSHGGEAGHQPPLTMTGAWRSARGQPSTSTAGGAMSSMSGAPPSPLSSAGGAGAGPLPGGKLPEFGAKATLSSGGGGGSKSAAAQALRALLECGIPLQPTLSQAVQAALALAEAEEQQEQEAAMQYEASLYQQAQWPGHAQQGGSLNYYVLQQQQRQQQMQQMQQMQMQMQMQEQQEPRGPLKYASQVAAAAQSHAASARPVAAYYMATDRVQPALPLGGYSGRYLRSSGSGSGRKPSTVGKSACAGGLGDADAEAILGFLRQQQVQGQLHKAPAEGCFAACAAAPPSVAAPAAAAAPPPTQPFSRGQTVSALRRSSAGGAAAANAAAAPLAQRQQEPAAPLRACGGWGEALAEGRQVLDAAFDAEARSSPIETRSMPYELSDLPAASAAPAEAPAEAVALGAGGAWGLADDWELSLAAAEAGEACGAGEDLESGLAQPAGALPGAAAEQQMPQARQEQEVKQADVGAELAEVVVVDEAISFSGRPRLSCPDRVLASPHLPASPHSGAATPGASMGPAAADGAAAAALGRAALARRLSKLSASAAALGAAPGRDLPLFSPGPASSGAGRAPPEGLRPWQQAGDRGAPEGADPAPSPALDAEVTVAAVQAHVSPAAVSGLGALLCEGNAELAAPAKEPEPGSRRAPGDDEDGAVQELLDTAKILCNGPAADGQGQQHEGRQRQEQGERHEEQQGQQGNEAAVAADKAVQNTVAPLQGQQELEQPCQPQEEEVEEVEEDAELRQQKGEEQQEQDTSTEEQQAAFAVGLEAAQEEQPQNDWEEHADEKHAAEEHAEEEHADEKHADEMHVEEDEEEEEPAEAHTQAQECAEEQEQEDEQGAEPDEAQQAARADAGGARGQLWEVVDEFTPDHDSDGGAGDSQQDGQLDGQLDASGWAGASAPASTGASVAGSTSGSLQGDTAARRASSFCRITAGAAAALRVGPPDAAGQEREGSREL